MQFWQILLLTLYSAYQICDELTIVSSAGSPVFAGFIAGLIMGDLQTGLYIGGSLQLMVLGVGTFGGASRPDGTSGAVLATAFAVSSNMDPEKALALIAVPVSLLMVYTDVLGRFTTTYFAHRVDAAVEKFDYKGIELNYLLGAIPWALSRSLPVFLALAFGQGIVADLGAALDQGNLAFIGAGLKLAGKMLPGVGFAILLRYLPVKKNLAYLGLGFVLTAMLGSLYGGISTLSSEVGRLFPAVQGLLEKSEDLAAFSFNFNGLPMIGVAVIGFALAAISFKNSQNVTVVSVSNSESGEIEDDEI